ncbi:hypothetical protein HYR99_34000 [Candidatus Poribacteria bacterium]|nr:hypothetical protein [Candidatus Poribacteria bacterium]
MQKQVVSQSIDYAQAIAELVATMPIERAAQVYDFARFLQAQSVSSSLSDKGADVWLNDSEEQMQAEEALWDAAYARHRDKFSALAEAARAEITAGTTQPMFDENGEFTSVEESADALWDAA